MEYKYCAYCKGRVFEQDRKCPSCGSAVFVFEEKPTPREEAVREDVGSSAATPPPVYVNAPVRTVTEVVYVPTRSQKNRWFALLLCFVLGIVGAHRFYVGKVASGVVYLLTGGLFGIGVVVDFLMILFGNFHDKSGLPLNG